MWFYVLIVIEGDTQRRRVDRVAERARLENEMPINDTKVRILHSPHTESKWRWDARLFAKQIDP